MNIIIVHEHFVWKVWTAFSHVQNISNFLLKPDIQQIYLAHHHLIHHLTLVLPHLSSLWLLGWLTWSEMHYRLWWAVIFVPLLLVTRKGNGSKHVMRLFSCLWCINTKSPILILDGFALKYVSAWTFILALPHHHSFF